MLNMYLLSFYTNCGQMKHFICPLDAVWAAHIKQWSQSWYLEKQGFWDCFRVAQKVKPMIGSDFSRTVTLNIVIFLVGILLLIYSIYSTFLDKEQWHFGSML